MTGPTGMSASLRAGLAALVTPGLALVTLVDLPDVTAEVARRVLAVATGTTSLARASYDARPGHPVLLGSDHWPGVVEVSDGDEGAKPYLRRHAVRLVECSDLASGEDQDRPST